MAMSLGKLGFTILGFHRMTRSRLYVVANCASLDLLKISAFILSDRFVRPSRAGCSKGNRSYSSGPLGNVGSLGAATSRYDVCKSTIRFPRPNQNRAFIDDAATLPK